MTNSRILTLLAMSLIFFVTLADNNAHAQHSRQKSPAPIEFSATFGSMWGGNLSVPYGKLRTATGPSYGVALDIPLDLVTALELSYTFQDGAIDYDSRGSKTKLTDMDIHFWQIGVVRGLTQGKVRPFITSGIGATNFSPSAGSVVIDDEEYNISSATKFSLMLGLGFKAYFGEAEKIGVRASIKTFPTLYDAGGGLWFGSGGVSVGVSGSAIWQWEAAAGLTVKFGARG
ncbi:MAG: outer membrane beta-barrel protein [bacterium]|nr:outer membrane beta-barrel protein [bacterium]